MRTIEDSKKITKCVNEILNVLEANGLSEEEIVGVLKTTEACLGMKPPHPPMPPMPEHKEPKGPKFM